MLDFADISLLGVPVDCEGVAGGTARAPSVLRRLGLIDALPPLSDLNDLPVEIIGTLRDPESGIKAVGDVRHTIQQTHQQVSRIFAASSLPLLIGGCCTNVVGAVAAANQVLGRVGLVYIDGHLDLYDGKTSLSGDFADMPMSFILGRGNTSLGPATEAWPGLSPQDVCLVGYRDQDQARHDHALMPEEISPSPNLISADTIHQSTPAEIAAMILRQQQQSAGKYWLHLDWDVLDELAFPSSDYPMPNGLTWTQLTDLVRPLIQSPMLVGITTACYNPDKDPDYRDGRKIIEVLRSAFAE